MNAQDFLTGLMTGFIGGAGSLIVLAVLMKRGSRK